MIFGTYAYKPINKRLEDWEGPDLNVLKNISEGWYIDYKGADLTTEKKAKHLSAFANQYGGWLFFGVREGGNEKKAESFLGIAMDTVSSVLNSVRDICTKSVQPPLIFEEKVINGPIPEIGLSENASIVIIGVPRGLQPPYITSGKVYRRVRDKSEPTSETDYNVINSLLERRENSRKILDDFVSDIPSMPAHQKKSIWAHIFLITDPFFEDFYKLNLQDFALIMNRGENHGNEGIKMDNLFPTQNGYLCRHTVKNDPSNFLLNLRWWTNGNIRFSIPINTHVFGRVVSGDLISTQLEDYNNIEYQFITNFISLADNKGFSSIKVADFSYFFSVVMQLLNKYINLNKKILNEKPIYGRIILNNTLGISPFINKELCIEKSKLYGIPVVEDTDIYLPKKIDFSTLIRFQKFIDGVKHLSVTHKSNYDILSIPIGVSILIHVLRAVGIFTDPEDLNLIEQFFE